MTHAYIHTQTYLVVDHKVFPRYVHIGASFSPVVLNSLSLAAENIDSGTDPKKEDKEVPKGFLIWRSRRYSEEELRVDKGIRTKTMTHKRAANHPVI